MINLIKTTGNSRLSYAKETANRFDHLEVQYYAINGISSCNDYVPIAVAPFNLGVYNNEIVHYSIPFNSWRNLDTHTSYNQLYNGLANNTLPQEFKTKSMDTPLMCAKGLLFKEENGVVEILFAVGVKTPYMKEANKIPDDELIFSKFKLFLSTKFYSDPLYRSIFNKMNKEMFIPHIKLGVELTVVNNVEEHIFKNDLPIPKFRSIDGLQEYLDSFNKIE